MREGRQRWQSRRDRGSPITLFFHSFSHTGSAFPTPPMTLPHAPKPVSSSFPFLFHIFSFFYSQVTHTSFCLFFFSFSISVSSFSFLPYIYTYLPPLPCHRDAPCQACRRNPSSILLFFFCPFFLPSEMPDQRRERGK